MPAKKTKSKPKETPRFFQAPKGMHDVLPPEQPYWEKIESVAAGIARFYGFGKIDTPILEQAELFIRGTGESTDIVEKEMFTLKTKGGDFLALRPEFTPAVSRAYLEHSLSRLGQPQKFFQFGPLFRHERPQQGRSRQFTQIGFEMLGGPNDPVHDALLILIAVSLLRELKIKEVSLKINSIGCRVCRPIYKKQLQNYYKNHEKELCSDCVRRLKVNPLRLLDCKNPDCEKLKAKAPNFLDKLCANCSHHMQGVLEYLDELKISYALDNTLVRGLDYYTKTVFEVFTEGPGSELGALCGGGRYDYLIELLGGYLTPAVGFASGVERLIAAMKAKGIELAPKSVRRVFVAHAGDAAKKKALSLIKMLHDAEIPVAEALSKESLKAQLKAADKDKSAMALILGQKEIYENSVIIRDLRTGLQESIASDRIVDEIRKRWRL